MTNTNPAHLITKYIDPTLYVDTADAADRISVDPRTVRKLIREGVLDAVNVGSAKRPVYRIRLMTLMALGQSGDVSTEQPTRS